MLTYILIQNNYCRNSVSPTYLDYNFRIFMLSIDFLSILLSRVWFLRNRPKFQFWSISKWTKSAIWSMIINFKDHTLFPCKIVFLVHLQTVQNCNFDSFRRQRGSTEIEVSKQIQHVRLDSSKHFPGPKFRPLPRPWPPIPDLHPYLVNIMLIYS